MKIFSRPRWLPRALLAIGALLTGGCSGVYTLQPFGEKPAKLDPADWNGTWNGLSSEVAKSWLVQVVDAEHGELRISGIEKRDGKLSLESLTVFVRVSGDRLFASVREKPDERFGSNRDPSSPEFRHAWGMLAIDHDLLFVWAPDVEKFTALVQEGKLKGKVETGDVIPEILSPADTQAIATDALGVLFQWEKPLVFHRVGKGSP